MEEKGYRVAVRAEECDSTRGNGDITQTEGGREGGGTEEGLRCRLRWRHAGLPGLIPLSLGELVACCCAYETVSQRNATWSAAKCSVEKNAKNQHEMALTQPIASEPPDRV